MISPVTVVGIICVSVAVLLVGLGLLLNRHQEPIYRREIYGWYKMALVFLIIGVAILALHFFGAPSFPRQE